MKLSLPIVDGVARAYRLRTEPESILILARGFWRALIAAVLIADLCAIGWGVIILKGALDSIQGTQSSQHTAAPVLDRGMLSETLEAFESRSGRFDALKSSRLPLTDPAR